MARTARLTAAGALAVAALLAGSAGASAGPGPEVTGAGLPLAGGGVQPVPDAAGIIDAELLMDDVDCDTAQLLGPAATSASHLVGDEAPVRLDVLVLVDVAEGAKIAATKDRKRRAAAEKALFAKVAKRLEAGKVAYEPLGIDLSYGRFALLAPLTAKGAPRTRTDDATKIIELAKQQYGGKRPAGVDVVYTVTDLDIQVPGIGNAVAGLADCIGGVALADRAFAVGETVPDDASSSSVPLNTGEFTAKIAAHEIGHLMGGHHHYQECGTPALTAVSRGEVGPCSLMTNAANFLTLQFSTLNGVVARGHAEQFADQR